MCETFGPEFFCDDAMNTLTPALPVESQPSEVSLERDIGRARWLANWLDSKFSILGFRFGIEGVIGFVPVVGDTLGAVAGIYPIYVAGRHKLGKTVQAKMALNLGVEWLLGVTPVVGDLADAWFKANLRNLKLLEQAAASPR
jgi:hypothetical protein